jgi:hypothetical protein
MILKLIRSVLLLLAGAVAGFAGAAAFMRHAVASEGNEDSDELALVAIFNGIELANRSATFRGGTVLAWFGGVSLDLREATLAPGANIDIRAMFGGVAIRVPPTWRVEAHGTAVAGGWDNRAVQPDESEAPALLVNVVASLGGVSITN